MIDCKLDPADAVQVIHAFDAKQNCFQLLVHDCSPRQSIVLELWEDGEALPHKLVLLANGTWSMRTAVKV
ncbi:hypothetical protein [Chromobacterium sp. ASV23]|uniref:hypothetical protein n=1 Tax=Chromobacterium sp. ASV23 TaxID=2795110 RepID=UPI0018EE3749|nr:hypothetical protein [Chromobacterium sp. ASV23]